MSTNKEAVSRDHIVVTGGSLSKGEWKNVRRAKAITPAGQLFPTNIADRPPKEIISPNDYDFDQKRYVRLIETVSPLLIDRTATVKIINDKDLKIRGCSRWEAQGISSGTFIFEINLAFHDCSDWQGNYYLLIHELAHHKVQSNDHLVATFYETVNELGATLAELAIDQPELFEMANEGLGKMAA